MTRDHKFEYLLIWTTIGSTEYLLAVRNEMRGCWETLCTEFAGLQAGGYEAIARKIEEACMMSEDRFTMWIDDLFEADYRQHPDNRETQKLYPDENGYDDFQIIRHITTMEISPNESMARYGTYAHTTVYLDMLGDDPEKVKQSRAADVIDKLARLAHQMESATKGYAGLKRVTVYDTDKVFEILTEAVELLQDAYEGKEVN